MKNGNGVSKYKLLLIIVQIIKYDIPSKFYIKYKYKVYYLFKYEMNQI